MPLIITCALLTVWLHVAVLPHRSVAIQVRMAVNVWLQLPFVIVSMTAIVTFVPSAKSRAAGSSNDQATPHKTALLDAQVMLGGVLSITLMIWVHEARLLQLSVTSQVRATANEFPQKPALLVMVLTTVIRTFEPSQRSLADGGSKSQSKPSSTVLFVAQTTAGGSVSATRIV